MDADVATGVERGMVLMRVVRASVSEVAAEVVEGWYEEEDGSLQARLEDVLNTRGGLESGRGKVADRGVLRLRLA